MSCCCLMRVRIYIPASAPTRAAAPHSFIKIHHFTNHVDSGPHPGLGRAERERGVPRVGGGGGAVFPGNLLGKQRFPVSGFIPGATGGERRCCTDKSSSFGFDSGTDAIIGSTRRARARASSAPEGEEPRPGA